MVLSGGKGVTAQARLHSLRVARIEAPTSATRAGALEAAKGDRLGLGWLDGLCGGRDWEGEWAACVLFCRDPSIRR